jgi:DNA processing protein
VRFLDLVIARLPGARSLEKAALCRRFNDEAEFYALKEADIEQFCLELRGLKRQGRLFSDEPDERWSMKSLREAASRDAAFMEKRGIGWVSLVEDAYPPLLKEIYDPPAALFFRGKLPEADRPLCAIVGTRKAGGASLDWTYRTGRALGKAGVTVVSGLALGIDAMAHRGNLDGGGKTLAVFGSSVDEVYPSSNRSLARRVLEEGGAFLSEYPPGTEPMKWHFPQRNRIISGLCKCTVVVEAGAKSGALITADFALEQNRDVGVAVDGGGSPFGEGCRRLAEDGAALMKGEGEILAELGVEVHHQSGGNENLAESLARELGL